MGEKGTNGSRLAGARSGKFLALGTTGFATAMTLLMILAPASGALVHPSIVLTPAYKNTVASPNTYWSTSGCAMAKAAAPHWNAATGGISGADSASAKTCAKSLGGVGGSSFGDASSGMSVAIPFKVASNGNHAISTSFSVKIASSSSFTYASCPKFTVTYPPALNQYEYAYCEAGASLSMYVNLNVVDLTNSSWYGNYSYADSYNESYFENYTDCYNYGTPTCYNYSAANTYNYNYSYNAAGFTAFSWNGATTWTMWTNGTNMIKTHHYALILSISVSADTYAEYYHTLTHWAASAVGMVNMATLGNGAKINSVTIA